MIRKTLNLFTALMAGLTDKAAQAALLNMQKSIDYCMEENRVLWEQLKDKYGCKRMKLTDSQRRRRETALSLNVPIRFLRPTLRRAECWIGC